MLYVNLCGEVFLVFLLESSSFRSFVELMIEREPPIGLKRWSISLSFQKSLLGEFDPELSGRHSEVVINESPNPL